ncbi:MAG: DUF721 domain-containing protein [Opitutae bacterium]|nr:DUF721 domain-containing protein [Opitutae bacterium]
MPANTAKPAGPDEPYRFSRLAEELIGDLRGVPFHEPARMKRRPTRDLSPLIHELLAKHHIGQHSPEDSIREHWVEIVGAANAAYAHAAQIDARCRLVILASHSVVRNELFLHRQSILPKIQQLPGCGHVKSLLIRAG